jgi:hypothetical protein
VERRKQAGELQEWRVEQGVSKTEEEDCGGSVLWRKETRDEGCIGGGE